MGRKNHLFVGSEQGGKTAAIFYSLIETCRQNDVNPVLYTWQMCYKEPPTHPNRLIEELLPYNWEKLPHQPTLKAA